VSTENIRCYQKLALDTRSVAELSNETAIRAELLMMAQRFDKLAEYAERRHQKAVD
jgi:hypothetical protein